MSIPFIKIIDALEIKIIFSGERVSVNKLTIVADKFLSGIPG